MTNFERIKEMSAEELADFFFESPEVEFGICAFCENFGGHFSPTPCKTKCGLCYIPSKNKAFKKYLEQESKR